MRSSINLCLHRASSTWPGELRFLDGCMPEPSTTLSVGYDLRAAFKDEEGRTRRIRFRNPQNLEYDVAPHVDELFPDGTLTLEPAYRCLMPVGVWSELPDAIEVQIRPRSGLAWKHGIGVLNAPGTVDPDFKDEWHVILENRSRQPFEIRHLDRIAQALFLEVQRGWYRDAATLATRVGGYGSTGR